MGGPGGVRGEGKNPTLGGKKKNCSSFMGGVKRVSSMMHRWVVSTFFQGQFEPNTPKPRRHLERDTKRK